MSEIERHLRGQILELLEFFPAVALLGPRQCGKTTLAHLIEDTWPEASYLDLERASDLAKLEDAAGYLEPLENKLIILDEVQNRPGLFPELRGLIDRGRRRGLKNGRFLLLGSASYELLRQSGESLAGRIAYLELSPFRIEEVGASSLDQLWLRGGFPDSFLAPNDALSMEWRRNFIDTYLSRDLGLLEKVGPFPAMKNLMQMLAHLHGQLLNLTPIVESHEFSRAAINNYLDLFEQTFVIRRLQPWFANVGKRLTKRPKMFVRDTGLLHYLLNLPDEESLRGHPSRGASWEGFVIEHIISMLPDWEPYFYRTSHGAELDLLMVRGQEKIAFEIKASPAPKLTRGFHTAREDVKPGKIFVVSRADETWKSQDDIVYTNLEGLSTALGQE